MLFLLLLPGVREEQGRKREHCRERSQENLTWVEWRGAQRAVVAELVWEDQSPQCGNRAHGCIRTWAKKGPDLP